MVYSKLASNGWLESWKKRHNIKQVVVSGESGDVSGTTISSWKERLPEVIAGYTPRDVWNIDKIGCFWRTLPEKGFGKKGQECKGGKKSKHGQPSHLLSIELVRVNVCLL